MELKLSGYQADEMAAVDIINSLIKRLWIQNNVFPWLALTGRADNDGVACSANCLANWSTEQGEVGGLRVYVTGQKRQVRLIHKEPIPTPCYKVNQWGTYIFCRLPIPLKRHDVC